jgi:hypothetical protein
LQIRGTLKAVLGKIADKRCVKKQFSVKLLIRGKLKAILSKIADKR